MKNKITQGDCLELIKKLPDNSVDMILTDPPYFEEIKFGGSFTKNNKKLHNLNSNIKPRDWWEEAIRVSKKINWIIWIDDRHQLLDYLLLIKESGFSFYQLIWQKPNPNPFKNAYLKDKEVALYVYKEAPISFKNDFNDRKTIFNIRANSGNGYKNDFVNWHPTPKPISLIKKLIEKHTQEGHVVLDMFSGSGTNAVACKQLKRDFISFELDDIYFKKSVERLESEGNQLIFNF